MDKYIYRVFDKCHNGVQIYCEYSADIYTPI